MDWDDLHSFLAIARARSLSGAARALGVGQSTMSRRLAGLEQRAGARLLQKGADGYALTPLGEAVLGNAERMEAEAIAIERIVQGRDVALSGLVRITTVEILARRLLPPAIAALQARYPAIAVDVLPESRALSLSKREADVALRMVPFDGNELVTRRMGDCASALYASPAYLARHSAPLDSAEHAVITVMEDQLHLDEPKWLARLLPRARPALRTNNRDVQLEAARAGLGLACLPCYTADAASDLQRVASAGFAPPRTVWLGVHADLRQMPRIRALIEVLDAEFRRQKAQLMPPAAAAFTAPASTPPR